MKSKFLGIFSKKPIVWFHYLLLTGVLFLAFFSLSWVGIVNMVTPLSLTKWVILFIWYFAFISIGDQIIHKILGI
jgi:hypothetical protein